MAAENLKHHVYQQILEDIYDGILPPGSILNEKSLMEKYGCSKSPVREALVSLCTEGVLKNIPRYGYEVTRLTLDDISEMLSYRYYVESGLLKEQAEHFTMEQIKELETLNEACMRDDLPPRQHWETNIAFHKRMIYFCGNRYAEEQMDACYKRLTRAYAKFHWGQGTKLEALSFQNDCSDHLRILVALRNHDIKQLLQELKQFKKIWSLFEK